MGNHHSFSHFGACQPLQTALPGHVDANATAAMSQEQAEVSPAQVQSADQSSPTDPSGSPPACFVITHSVAKKHNIGTIARCSTAFGVKEVCLAGSRQYNSFGSHGAEAHVNFRHFQTLEQCVQHLKEVEHCEIVGIEITEDALPVQTHPFTGPTAFMLGNEGQGMTPRQMALCDKFVYIPQFGCGTASLNVAVATSIVLHHFATWAGYQERSRHGYKFDVAERPVRTQPRGVVADPDQVRSERRATVDPQEQAEQEDWATQAMSSLLE